MASTVRLATRASPLARWQAEHVADRIRSVSPGSVVELVVVDTTGDRRQDRPISEIGGQGVFVKEVQAAVLDGRADVAVHSAKDLPSSPAPGLVLGAVPVRADPRDALVGCRLADLGPGARVATGSVRRRAQLASFRPDLTFDGLRGNIATRLARIPPGGAIVMAAAAIERLGVSGQIELLAPSVMLPQVGQGAIALARRDPDARTAALMAAIDDPGAHAEVRAERGFLARLGGGCDLPVGSLARRRDQTLHVEAMLASLDGRVVLRTSASGGLEEGPSMGAALAEELLSRGGDSLLDDAGMGRRR